MSIIHNDLVLVRVGTEDYDKVMAIRKKENIYGGEDYLQCYFHRLLNSSNVMAFAASLNGKYIAFTIASIVDDGKTWIQRSNRVSEDYEGRGVMKWLQENVEKVVLSETSAVYEASAVSRYSERNIRNIAEEKSYVAADRKLSCFAIEKDILKTILKSTMPKENLKILNERVISEIIENRDLSTKLFGNERILIQWIPFRPMNSNISIILQETMVAIGSDLSNIQNALVTFSSSYEGTKETIYIIDVYGAINKHLCQHILEHLRRGSEAEHKTIKMYVFYGKDHEKDIIERTMKGNNFCIRSTYMERGICIERELQRNA